VTVYVDNMRRRVGRLIMCHMIADTQAELHEMADRIGVARRWHEGDHYDIALCSRALAVSYGAKEITQRDCSLMTIKRRKASPDTPLLTPKEGLAFLRELARNYPRK